MRPLCGWRFDCSLSLSLSLFLLLASPAFAQASTPPATASPEAAIAAASIAAKALTTLDGGVSLRSVRLTGSVTSHFGPAQTGAATLEAMLGPNGAESRVEFDLPSGTRVEIRGYDSTGSPWGAWVGAKGIVHAMPLENCWTPSTWFLPRLSVLRRGHAGDALLKLPAAPAPAAGSGEDVHLRKDRVPPGQTARMSAEIKRLSTADLYLDPARGAPVSLHYVLHPDSGVNRDIPVEVRFSDFQRVSGVEIPFHIERYMEHALDYDITISEAEINPSLDEGDFTEPAVVASAYVSAPGSKPASAKPEGR